MIRMDEMKRDELYEPTKAKMEELGNQRFIMGMKAGYDAAMLHIYKATKDMTSAKVIRAYIKQKVDEGAVRHLAAKEDENG